jgi:hypothetical protein
LAVVLLQDQVQWVLVAVYQDKVEEVHLLLQLRLLLQAQEVQDRVVKDKDNLEVQHQDLKVVEVLV